MTQATHSRQQSIIRLALAMTFALFCCYLIHSIMYRLLEIISSSSSPPPPLSSASDLFTQVNRMFTKNLNKCIGDDTKAATRQSLNCIKNNNKKFCEKRFSIWRMEFLHQAMWHDHELTSPGDCMLQCGMWL